MDFAHPHFAEPRWLWLAILGPLALAIVLLLAEMFLPERSKSAATERPPRDASTVKREEFVVA